MFIKIFLVVFLTISPLFSFAFISNKGEIDIKNVIDSEIFIANTVSFKYTTDVINNKTILSEVSEQISPSTIRFYSSSQFFNDGVNWLQVEYGTTTVKEFLKAQPLSFFRIIKEAIAVYFPDSDGFIARDASDIFSEVRSGAGTSNNTAGSLSMEVNRASGLWNRWRILKLVFDTSTLPDNETVATASFFIKTDGITGNTFTQSVVITSNNTGTIANQDYTDHLTNMNTEYSRIAWASMGGGGIYTDFVFNSAGKSAISLIGLTGIGVTYSMDFDNTDPGINGNQEINFRSSEHTGTDSDPYLDITTSVVDDPLASSTSATSTFSTSTTMTYYDSIFIYMVIIFLLSFISFGIIFSLWRR